jgi:hypothetical protein
MSKKFLLRLGKSFRAEIKKNLARNERTLVFEIQNIARGSF